MLLDSRPAKNASTMDNVIKELPRPNYIKLTNEELYDLLHEHNIEIPRDDKGALVRKHAVHELMKWDDLHAHLYNVDPEVRVTFHHPGGTAMEYAFISLNGKPYQVPYGQEVTLPASVVRVVDDAIEYQFKYKEDHAAGQMVPVVKPTRALNYTFHGVVEEAKPEKKAASSKK